MVPKLSPILDEASLEALATALEARRPVMRSDWVKWAASLLVSAILAYGVVNARVAVLEDRVAGMKDSIAEIRQDIKTLLRRMP